MDAKKASHQKLQLFFKQKNTNQDGKNNCIHMYLIFTMIGFSCLVYSYDISSNIQLISHCTHNWRPIENLILKTVLYNLFCFVFVYYFACALICFVFVYYFACALICFVFVYYFACALICFVFVYYFACALICFVFFILLCFVLCFLLLFFFAGLFVLFVMFFVVVFLLVLFVCFLFFVFSLFLSGV